MTICLLWHHLAANGSQQLLSWTYIYLLWDCTQGTHKHKQIIMMIKKEKKRKRKIQATVQLTTQTTRPTQYIKHITTYNCLSLLVISKREHSAVSPVMHLWFVHNTCWCINVFWLIDWLIAHYHSTKVVRSTQAPRSTQPGHPYVGRHNKYQRKLGRKQAHRAMH